MSRRLISVFAALCLVSQMSLALEVSDRLLITGGVLAIAGMGLGIPTTILASIYSNDNSETTQDGEIAGAVLGWAACATGLGLLVAGFVGKYCPCTSDGIPPQHEPITKDPATNPGTTLPVIPPQTAPDGSVIIPIDG